MRDRNRIGGARSWRRGIPVALCALAAALGGVTLIHAPRGGHQTPPPGAPPGVGGLVIGGRVAAESIPATARRAGERFLQEYVAYLYGHRPAGRFAGASHALRASLRRAHARVPPARAARAPAIVHIAAVAQTPTTVIVSATVDDGDVSTYQVSAVVEERARSWRVTRLQDD